MNPNYEMIAAIPKILRDISSGAGFSTSAFNETTDISPNTIKKYLSRLKDCYLLKNMYAYDSRDHKWKALQPGFLNYTSLAPEEIVMLCMIEKYFGTKQDETVKRWLKRHLVKNARRADTRIFKNTPIESIKAIEKLFPPIKNAIQDHITIEFTFNNELKRVNPYKILNLEGYWYLAAMDYSKNKFRTYTMANIEDLIITNEKFTIDSSYNQMIDRLNSVITAYMRMEGDYIDVTLEVHEKIHKHFIRKPISPRQQPLGKIAGTPYYRLNISITNHAEIVPTVLRHMPLIKVISPKCLNEYIQEAIRNYDQKDLTSLTKLENICKDS